MTQEYYSTDRMTQIPPSSNEWIWRFDSAPHQTVVQIDQLDRRWHYVNISEQIFWLSCQREFYWRSDGTFSTEVTMLTFMPSTLLSIIDSVGPVPVCSIITAAAQILIQYIIFSNHINRWHFRWGRVSPSSCNPVMTKKTKAVGPVKITLLQCHIGNLTDAYPLLEMEMFDEGLQQVFIFTAISD